MKGLWSFFQILSPQFAKCTLCGLELGRGTSNVNSFFGHLENNHKEEWSKTLCGVKLWQHNFTIATVVKLLTKGLCLESGLHSPLSRSSRCPRPK